MTVQNQDDQWFEAQTSRYQWPHPHAGLRERIMASAESRPQAIWGVFMLRREFCLSLCGALLLGMLSGVLTCGLQPRYNAPETGFYAGSAMVMAQSLMKRKES